MGNHIDSYGWSHVALIIVYILMLFYSIYVGVRIRKIGSVLEKIIFHGIFTIASLCKIVSFIVYILVTDEITQISINGNLVYFLSSVPSFLFLSVYSIVLLKCFEFYQILEIHKVIWEKTRKKIIILMYLALFTFYLGLLVLYIIDFTVYPLTNESVNSPVTDIEKVIQVIDASVYVIAAFGFFLFMYYYYREYFAEVKSRIRHEWQTRLFKRIFGIILSTFVAFIFRSPFVIVSIFLPLNVWWKDILYYGLFECLPLLLLCYVWLVCVEFVHKTETAGGMSNSYQDPVNFHTPLITKNKV